MKKGKGKQIGKETIDNKKRNLYEENEEENEKELNKKLLKLARETYRFDEIMILTYNKVEEIKLTALQRLCPCRVNNEITRFWDRIFELVNDPSPKIRMQVLHNMCDGSPDSYEDRVVEALEIFNRDKDSKIRRKAHKVIGSYAKTGKWNIL